MNKIKNFFRLNLISLKLDHQYKFNLYIILLLFICIISSIIVRTNIINLLNNELLFMIKILVLFTVLYTLKLIFYIVKRIIQGYKIIPNFYQ
jgi:hypothetical protein